MISALPHTIGLVIPAAILLGAWLGGGWTFLAVVLLYVGMPIVDAACGLSRRNPAEGDPALGDNPWFRAITWGWVPVQLTLIAWAMWFVARRAPTSLDGETLYRFLPRTVAGSLKSAWELERARLLKRRCSTWSWRTRFLRYALTQAFIYGALTAWLGPGRQ